MIDRELTIIENCQLGTGTEVAEFSVLKNCKLGKDCRIWRFVNMYGCDLGDECMVGSHVEIQPDVDIHHRCRIQSHSFICSLVTIESDVFVGHGVMFINDLMPPSNDSDAWERTHVGSGAVIGSNATLLPVHIGEDALVGAGAVVTEDVPPNAIVAGNPAEIIDVREP